ncbi:P-loop containing nucleoside triphosphate hydrolase protein [Diaporthe amygdali]|uniref:P-loop containing nucleoside triphosphate hydrolase protein n=1 Tax=Phomopsis amygdali TaxID=1214568 RepID=UPI0022FED471|nr:P-loop containing nucleoside triphosphate hydrolase protein [Diaporthe amygdali]KAJ0109953.1 P-loop containing nucleoside triphosphate hydrolase protein [Diaporthe amygdali]
MHSYHASLKTQESGSRKRRRTEDDDVEDIMPRYVILHRVDCPLPPKPMHENHLSGQLFWDPPRLFKGDMRNSALRGTQPLNDIDAYLEDNPDVIFIVERAYNCAGYHESEEISRMFTRLANASQYRRIPSSMRSFLYAIEEDLQPALPASEQICRFSQVLLNALTSIEEVDFPPDVEPWHDGHTLSSPYLPFYFGRKALQEVVNSSSGLESQQIGALMHYLESSFGEEYREADDLFESGYVSQRHFQKLFGPRDVVVIEDDGHHIGLTVQNCPRFEYHMLTLKCETWSFHGSFQRDERDIMVHFPMSPARSEKVPISSLTAIPLRFDRTGLEERLMRRGRFFWNCRKGGLVTSIAPRRGFEIRLSNPRYMIDMATYNELHGKDQEKDEEEELTPPKPPRRDDLGPDAMESDEAPSGSFVLLLPPTIPAFRFHDKKWQTLPVEYLLAVNWDKSAFRRLVLDPEKKDLIQALVQNHLANTVSNSADLIEGKGNGLIILLHGGPGTGKTLTAESVAELAERPLYRLTCGDIGTDPETVEKSLEWIFQLGTLWQAVVLLDESEVFLEERSQADLQQVHYRPIFILPTKELIVTVGIFDEAFKSRIQLAIYYPPHDDDHRIQLWENFFNLLREDMEKDPSLQIELEDLQRSVRKLARHALNGREIRNAIRTARQLALFRGQALSSIHLEQTIRVAKEFDKYIEDTKGHTDAELADALGIRKDKTSKLRDI